MIAKDKSGQRWDVEPVGFGPKRPTVVFCSKYALTVGIKPIVVESEQRNGSDYYWDGYSCYTLGRDIHWTPEEAHARAKEMAAARVKSLEKALVKAKAAAASGVKFVGKKA